MAEKKIVRQKLSDQVLKELMSMIRSGELGPDDFVPSERELMDRFGVGRPAIREALQTLHMQGLITIRHGERSRVNKLTADAILDQTDDIARMLFQLAPKNLDHLKQARRMFERGIIRAATEVATKVDIAELRALIVEQSENLDDPKAFIESDMRFHTRIAEITGNPIVSAASSAMLRWLQEYHTALLHWSGKENITLEEHARIVDCIEAKDADAAVEELQKHLDRSVALYRSSNQNANT